MAMKCEEELQLLEKMLMELEYKKVVDKEEKCSRSIKVESEINVIFNLILRMTN